MQPNALALLSDRPTMDQWFSLSPIQLLTSSDFLNWNTVGVRYAHLNPTSEYLTSPSTEAHSLLLLLEGANYLEGKFAGGSSYGLHTFPGSLFSIPRHLLFNARWNAPSKVAFIHLSHTIITESLASCSVGDPARVELRELINSQDPLLRQLCSALVLETQNAGLLGSLFAESVALTMTLHLLRNYSNIATIRDNGFGTLSPRQRRIIEEYIHENCQQKITLSDLASCIHLSVPHFARMFRATFHCSPYQYVLTQRIEKAKLLLTISNLSLADVAHDCGFANQSHLTKTFSRFVGVSPARFAREQRS